MSLTDHREGRAAAFAACHHDSQIRKYTGEPYIVHPARVAGLVRGLVTEDGLCAAWLHDVVEDCGIDLEQIGRLWGPRVRAIVSGLTSWSKHPDAPPSLKGQSRKVRKAADLDFLAGQDAEVQTIKVADLIDNTESIVANDHDFARVYLPEKEALLAVLTKAEARLWHRAVTATKDGLRALPHPQAAGRGG